MSRTIRRLLMAPASSLLLAVTTASPVAAQAKPDSAPPTGRSERVKDPAIATLLGVLHPGLGHYYVGDWATGRRVQFRALTAILTGLSLLVVGGVGDVCGTSCDADVAVMAVGVGAMAVGFGVWGYGAVDAPRAAHRANAARGSSLRLSPAYGRSRAQISAILTFLPARTRRLADR